MRTEVRKKTYYDLDGRMYVLENTKMLMRLFGKFKDGSIFKFTKTISDCDRKGEEVELRVLEGSNYTAAVAEVTLPSKGDDSDVVYMCLRDGAATSFTLQGDYTDGTGQNVHNWMQIKLVSRPIPLWAHILIIAVLLMLSALFSGLNLGLLSLDKTDLKVIINTGSQRERSQASKIVPVRNHGNFLLCCLVFSNVLVNTILTIMMDSVIPGSGTWETVALTTLAIVLIGEILPQAVCSRYGLAVGAETILITKFFMLVSFPLAYPVGKLLDKILGEEIGAVYTRDRLKELLKVTRDQHGLETEEMGIISGALEMKTKTVKDIMTPLDDIFMLPVEASFDFDILTEIECRGYTRIPIYEGVRANVVAIINVKQLTLVDLKVAAPVKSLVDFYKTDLFFVFENEKLDFMFRSFREGSRGHMAFVQKLNDEGPGDPRYETIGLVTMEDVLEELLQAEIYDENDVGRSHGKSGTQKTIKSLPYTYRKTRPAVHISPQLSLAATQYLVTCKTYSTDERIRSNFRLMGTSIHVVKLPKQISLLHPDESTVFLYEAGKPSDVFTMLIEGKVRVEVGKERLAYDGGPFTTFGVNLLMPKSEGVVGVVKSSISRTGRDKLTYIPDYTVKALGDLHVLKLTYRKYRQACTATEQERLYSNNPQKAAEKPDWAEEIAAILDAND
ncbi:Metal transporter CNNM4 [Orchesella cincta]|uniref:Metal transporter CNNM4 n=1 Tax=Orchesella cincta TaxID=48709 RepID=A0A1D2N4J9_ORCCI|nr:Metal transporter CNNM4 [Orchesella cincta]